MAKWSSKMTEYVYVVTNSELGWDCVCGVFKSNEGALRYIYNEPEHASLTEAEMEAMLDDNHMCYYIDCQPLEA